MPLYYFQKVAYRDIRAEGRLPWPFRRKSGFFVNVSKKAALNVSSTHCQPISKKGNSGGNESRLYLLSERSQRIYAISALNVESKSSL